MHKFKVICLAAMLFCVAAFPLTFIGVNGATVSNAEEITETELPFETAQDVNETTDDNLPDETTDEVQNENGDPQELVNNFIAWLKETYGEEYQIYYDAIIEKWGSIEDYLLALMEEEAFPDAAKDGWTKMVNWLGENSPVWGTALAVIAVVIVAVAGKKVLNKFVEMFTSAGKQTQALFGAVNKMYNAHTATEKALIKLMGDNPKFAEEKAALENSMKEISEEEKTNV